MGVITIDNNGANKLCCSSQVEIVGNEMKNANIDSVIISMIDACLGL